MCLCEKREEEEEQQREDYEDLNALRPSSLWEGEQTIRPKENAQHGLTPGAGV